MKAKKKQKNFTESESNPSVLFVAMKLALASGDPIPYDEMVRESKALSDRIPEEIKKEFRDRIRRGDLSVWQDENVMKYMR